jgi:broad specificity phosphatase PhoE
MIYQGRKQPPLLGIGASIKSLQFAFDAQSEGNKACEIHQLVPDHRIKLTLQGHKQALEAGHRLRAILRPDDTLHFFTSPCRRARETTF